MRWWFSLKCASAEKGVIVYFHDIYIPYDYPQFMCDHSRTVRPRPLCSAGSGQVPTRFRYFVSEDAELSAHLAPLGRTPTWPVWSARRKLLAADRSLSAALGIKKPLVGSGGQIIFRRSHKVLVMIWIRSMIAQIPSPPKVKMYKIFQPIGFLAYQRWAANHPKKTKGARSSPQNRTHLHR